MDLHAKGARAGRHGLTDAAHAKDAQTAPADPTAQKRGGGPALPLAGLHRGQTFGNAPRHGQNQGHGHIGGVIGDNARRVADQNAALAGGVHVDVIHTRAIVRDQFQPVTGGGQHPLINPVRDGRHQDIGPLHGADQILARHLFVGHGQLDVEEFGKTGLNHLR